MKKKIAGGVVAILVVLVAACLAYGPAGNPLGADPATTAAEMEKQDWNGGKLKDVTCLRASARTFSCMGTMKGEYVSHTVTVSFRGMWIANTA